MSRYIDACTADVNKIAQDAHALLDLYNIYGRGKISEWDWCFLYMRGELGNWLIKHYEEKS